MTPQTFLTAGWSWDPFADPDKLILDSDSDSDSDSDAGPTCSGCEAVLQEDGYCKSCQEYGDVGV